MALRESMFRFVFVVCAALWCASCASDGNQQMPPLDWHPRLDQPIDQLEEVLAATEQQQAMNYTSANLAFVLDAKLYLLFDHYVQSLPDEVRLAVVEEQRLWLEERKRVTDEAYAEYEGGSLASFARSQAFIESTKQRITVLEHRMRSADATTAP